MKAFIVFVAAVSAFAGAAQSAGDESIMFAPKIFFAFDFERGVSVSGTLTGDGVAYKNNTHVISCYRDRSECIIASVEQIGPNQIGRIEPAMIMPVVNWDFYELIAQEEPELVGCFRDTITIQKKIELVLWVREPANQTRPECAKSETRTLKWTIEDSIGMRKLHGTRR